MPGIVFSKESENEIESEVRQAVFDSDLAKLKIVINCYGICNTEVSHLLLNFAVEEEDRFTKYRTVFASNYILDLVERNFENEINNELIKFFDLEARLTKSMYSTGEFLHLYFKEFLFEIAFRRFVVNSSNKSAAMIHLQTSEEILTANLASGKEIREVDSKFEEIINKGGENILWKMRINFPLFHFLFFDRNEEIFNLYRVTTNNISDEVKWTSDVDRILNTIDPGQKFRINLIVAATKSKFRDIKKKDIQFKGIISNQRSVEQYSMAISETKSSIQN